MRNYISKIALSFALIIIINHQVFAELPNKILNSNCNAFQSSEDFVKRASLYCLNQANTRTCMKQAKNFFKQCAYAGDFKEISRDMQRKILVMILFTKSRDLSKSL